MTRSPQTRNRTRLFVSSTLGTTLVSILAVWTVLAVAPIAATPAVHATQPHGHNFQLSPIPPGADWTS